MNRTWPSQLISRLTNFLKVELLQNLLHLDFTAEYIEVDTGHVFILIETGASSLLSLSALPPVDAWNWAAQRATKIDGSFINREPVDSSP